jgi:hypothetical protein
LRAVHLRQSSFDFLMYSRGFRHDFAGSPYFG